jgi:hypothetical protein
MNGTIGLLINSSEAINGIGFAVQEQRRIVELVI